MDGRGGQRGGEGSLACSRVLILVLVAQVHIVDLPEFWNIVGN